MMDAPIDLRLNELACLDTNDIDAPLQTLVSAVPAKQVNRYAPFAGKQPLISGIPIL